jgi:hypothetical protein
MLTLLFISNTLNDFRITISDVFNNLISDLFGLFNYNISLFLSLPNLMAIPPDLVILLAATDHFPLPIASFFLKKKN